MHVYMKYFTSWERGAFQLNFGGWSLGKEQLTGLKLHMYNHYFDI